MSEAPDDVAVITDHRIDPAKFILADIDTSPRPHFNVSEVAKVFFARSPHWVRWREARGFFVLDEGTGQEKPVGNHRTQRGARYYTLSDVEEMAHALAQKQAITGSQLRTTLLLVENSARLWGYL
jgi:hypothetical protein